MERALGEGVPEHRHYIHVLQSLDNPCFQLRSVFLFDQHFVCSASGVATFQIGYKAGRQVSVILDQVLKEGRVNG